MATATMAAIAVLPQELIDEGHVLWNPQKPSPFTFQNKYRGQAQEPPLADPESPFTLLHEDHPLRQWIKQQARFKYVREKLMEGFDRVVIGPEPTPLSPKKAKRLQRALEKRRNKCAISERFLVARAWAKWGQPVTLPNYWLLEHDVMFGKWGLLRRDVYRRDIAAKRTHCVMFNADGSKRQFSKDARFVASYTSALRKARSHRPPVERCECEECVRPVPVLRYEVKNGVVLTERWSPYPELPPHAKRPEGRLFSEGKVVTHELSDQAKQNLWFYQQRQTRPICPSKGDCAAIMLNQGWNPKSKSSLW